MLSILQMFIIIYNYFSFKTTIETINYVLHVSQIVAQQMINLYLTQLILFTFILSLIKNTKLLLLRVKIRFHDHNVSI